MSTQRAHIVLPAELVEEIDELVGSRGRSAFIAEVASAEVKKRRLLAFLRSEEPVWKDEDHPELLEMGTAEWVRSLRDEPSTRLEDRDESLDPK
jgi:Arc/MetJ-type ribon-helix-helix transcriptional regulator